MDEEEEEYQRNETRIIDLSHDVMNGVYGALDEIDISKVIHEISIVYRLNTEQELALRLAGKTLSEQLFFIVCGEAGTGKSKCLEAMSGLFRALGEGHSIVASGTTGVSSARLRCRTIHSLCGWRTQKSDMEDENSRGIERLRKLLPKSLKLLLIDEISMLDAKMIWKIDQVFRKVFKRAHVMFGGISVCFSGDFFQLPPVGGHSLLKDVSQINKTKAVSLDTVFALSFWRSIDNVVLLRQNYRQEDPIYLNLLRNWKNGCMTSNDWRLLKSRQLKLMNHIPLLEEKDIYCIVKYNDSRNSLNKAILAHGEKSIIRCYAEDSCDSANINVAQKYLQEINDNRSNYFPGLFSFFIGAQVIFTHNYNPSLGIAKGTRAVVIAYDSEKDEIRVKLSSTAAQDPRKEEHCTFNNEYIVKRVNTSFTLQGHTIRRRQFGLDLGYAVTDYKSQGETVSRAFIDISNGTYYSIYVMLSRVRSIKGLYLLTDFDPTKINPVMPKALSREMSRLEILSEYTRRKYLC